MSVLESAATATPSCPDVLPVAAHLGGQHGANWLISIGCDPGADLDAITGDFFFAGIDSAATIDACRARHPDATWIERDLENPGELPFSREQLEQSVVVCAGVLERLTDPRPLLVELARLRRHALAIVLATPDRDRTGKCEGGNEPLARPHIRGWTLDELGELLGASGLEPAFLGHTIATDADQDKSAILAVVEGHRTPSVEKAPDGFRVLAVITGYNERDIVPHTIRRLLADGIEVVYVDNWSTDGTLEEVEREFAGRLRTTRFPVSDTGTYDWADLLGHVEQIGMTSDADWVVHHDADELRQPPWPGMTLRDGLWNCQLRGFNAVNHTVVDFRPVHAHPIPAGTDPVDAMTHWELLRLAANAMQIKAWRNEGQPVQLARHGGHNAAFPGRRVFPYCFLLRHYSLRSPEHARRKIFVDRIQRWNPQERQRGWHCHYDDITEADSFIWPAEDLHLWEEDVFAREFLTERLTGVGMLRGQARDWAGLVSNAPTKERSHLHRLRASRADLVATLTEREVGLIAAMARAEAGEARADEAGLAVDRARAEEELAREQLRDTQDRLKSSTNQLRDTQDRLKSSTNQLRQTQDRLTSLRNRLRRSQKRSNSASHRARRAEAKLKRLHASTTWRIGRAVVAPAALLRRIWRAGSSSGGRRR